MPLFVRMTLLVRTNQIRGRLLSRFWKNRRMKTSAAAFTLVEVLVVIAVIAIIATIALPNIANIVGSVNNTRDQRNAQSLAALSSAARSAGHPGWPGGKAEAITALVSGVSVTNSADSSMVIQFRMDTISAEDQAKASAYLSSDGLSLVYVPSGGQPTN